MYVRAVINVSYSWLLILALVIGWTEADRPPGRRMSARLRAFCPSAKCRCLQEKRQSLAIHMQCSSTVSGQVPHFKHISYPRLLPSNSENVTTELPSSIELSNITEDDVTSRIKSLDYIGDDARENKNITGIYSRHLHVASVSLNHANVTHVRNGAFAQLIELRSLDLSDNKELSERSLAIRAFRGVETSLEVLLLSNCALQTVPTHSLSSLHQLRSLHLDSNNITALPNNAFRGLTNLEELRLYRNQLSSIGSKAFRGLHQLINLKLYENALFLIEKGTFSGLHNLTSLDLSGNEIFSVGEGTFRELKQLRRLDLSDNSIFELSRGAFTGLGQLKYLGLLANPLTTIEDFSFRSLSTVNHLALTYVGQSSLTSSTFDGLRRLVRLQMEEVNEASLAGVAFAPLSNLQRLSFSNYSGRFDGFRLATLPTTYDVARMSVFVSPLGDCTCRSSWIRALVDRGVYFYGYCLQQQRQRPVKCFRRTKFTADDFATGSPPRRQTKPTKEEHGKKRRRRPLL